MPKLELTEQEFLHIQTLLVEDEISGHSYSSKLFKRCQKYHAMQDYKKYTEIQISLADKFHVFGRKEHHGL